DPGPQRGQPWHYVHHRAATGERGMTPAVTRRLLVVDDEESVLETIAAILRQEGYEVVAADTMDAALRHLRSQSFDLVLTDLRVEEESGLTLVAELQRHWPDTMSVVLTGYASL